jgi:hypothetical protein
MFKEQCQNNMVEIIYVGFLFFVNDNKNVDVNSFKPCNVLFIIIVQSCFVALKFKQWKVYFYIIQQME